MALGNNPNIAASTTGGDIWQFNRVDTSGSMQNVLAYGNNRFLVIQADKILASDDGVNWEYLSDGFAFTDVAYGNNRMVAVNGGGIFTSTDGFSWSPLFYGKNEINHIIYANDKFVGAGFGFIVSEDGSVWKQIALGYDDSIFDIVFGNDQYFAVSYDWYVFSSSDGYEWTRSDFLSNGIKSITFSGSRRKQYFIHPMTVISGLPMQ